MLTQPQTQWDALWLSQLLVTGEKGYGLIKQGAIAVQEGKIAWIGAQRDLSGSPAQCATHVYEKPTACITPGLIDCHTHLIYAGNRADEFAERLQGVSYEAIAQRGGGILSTVRATRAMSEEKLFEISLKRARWLMQNGVTTLEIKSGYGLDHATEWKILRVMAHLQKTLPITIFRTFLGAHTIPPEYYHRADHYVDLVCQEMIPKVAEEKLADAIDVFCDKIAFTVAQTERIFEAATHYQLAIKCHAEQLSYCGGASLAATYHALSVDHLEYATEELIAQLAHTQTVPVLLPGAFYFTHAKQTPPIEHLRRYHLPIAIATDCNPGTSPLFSLPLAMNMACVLFKMTPEEAFLGVTANAAKALGLAKTTGTLSIGKQADFAVWDISHPVELAYHMGDQALIQLVKAGQVIDVI